MTINNKVYTDKDYIGYIEAAKYGNEDEYLYMLNIPHDGSVDLEEAYMSFDLEEAKKSLLESMPPFFRSQIRRKHYLG